MAKAMRAPAFPKGQDAWTKPQADALLRAVEDMFHRRDVDCIVRFAEQPERRGRAALRQLFTARLARQQDYRLTKTLRALDGNVLANTWEGTWTDRETGRAMAGRGVEVWAMRDGMIAVWDAAFNIWEAGGERKSPVM
jgi:nuclear transport factor 2 (NTF2) superfamily protein